MQAQTESLLVILTVINGRDLVSSRCIKGRKKEKREVTFLPSSQVPLRVNFPFHIPFIAISGDWVRVWRRLPQKSPIVTFNKTLTQSLTHSPNGLFYYTSWRIFLRDKTVYLLIRCTEQIRCVNLKANTRVLTEPFFSF